MPARRLLMRKIREVLRLKYERGLSHRAIAQACAIGVGTVTLYLQRNSVKIGSLPRAPPRPCRHPSPHRAAIFMPTRVRLRRVEN